MISQEVHEQVASVVRGYNMEKDNIEQMFGPTFMDIIFAIEQYKSEMEEKERRARMVKTNGVKYVQPKPFTYEANTNLVHLAGIMKQLRALGYVAVKAENPNTILAFGIESPKPLVVELPKDIEVNVLELLGKEELPITRVIFDGPLKQARLEHDSQLQRNTDMRCVIQHKPNRLSAIKTVNGGEHILTLNGFVKTNPGDWIIRGVNGERYPCDEEIFKKLYDIVHVL